MVEGPRKIIVEIVEKFGRNPTVPAPMDIASRTFLLPQREIKLVYHYNDNCATASTRDFVKPTVAEVGEKLLWNPDLTAGYEADPSMKPPKQLALFRLLKDQLRAEEYNIEHVREVEDAIVALLTARLAENAHPLLRVDIFNKERNQKATEDFFRMERELREQSAREIETSIDLLGANLAIAGVLDATDAFTPALAALLKEDCLADLKALMLKRTQDIQTQYENMAGEVKRLRVWYAANIDSVTKEQETAYFKECGTLAFRLHVLEMRLARQAKISHTRFLELSEWLENDPRLLQARTYKLECASRSSFGSGSQGRRFTKKK